MLAQDSNPASQAGEAQASAALAPRAAHWDQVDDSLLLASGLKAARAAIQRFHTSAMVEMGGAQ